MNSPNNTKKIKGSCEVGLKATLEKKYIEEYLQSKGYGQKDLQNLPRGEAKRLMTEASTYASLKLADIEARSHFKDKIHWPF